VLLQKSSRFQLLSTVVNVNENFGCKYWACENVVFTAIHKDFPRRMTMAARPTSKFHPAQRNSGTHTETLRWEETAHLCVWGPHYGWCAWNSVTEIRSILTICLAVTHNTGMLLTDWHNSYINIKWNICDIMHYKNSLTIFSKCGNSLKLHCSYPIILKLSEHTKTANMWHRHVSLQVNNSKQTM